MMKVNAATLCFDPSLKQVQDKLGLRVTPALQHFGKLNVTPAAR
jgi:hypothetical protein